MSPAESFRAEAARRILVKDGAYGTMIQAERLAEADYRGSLPFAQDQRGNNDLLNLTRPELIEALCQRFADSGADIVHTDDIIVLLIHGA
jgi:5-methyltetrahydrofolate--homocysteine methyltransferase